MDAQQTTPQEARDPLKQLNAADWTLNDFLSLAFDYVELNLDSARDFMDSPGTKFEFASQLAARRALMQEMTSRGFTFNETAWTDQLAMEEAWQDRTTELVADYEAGQRLTTGT